MGALEGRRSSEYEVRAGRISDHGPTAESHRAVEDHGAVWRIRHLSDAVTIVDLCTCQGEPVDRVESEDPELIAYLRRSDRSVD